MESELPPITPALYLVPTPVGNLEDISYRALRVLREADVIACEDTRNTGQLLKLYGIQAKKLVALHAHNEHETSDSISELVSQQAIVAYCSDAGTPGISDPGTSLVRAALARNLNVVALPGASALLPALVASGLPTEEFLFVGFAPHKKGRKTFLDRITNYPFTVILYESPFRITALVEELTQRCPQRQVCIAREISKKFEEYLRGTTQELHELLKSRPPLKGEIVVILQGTTD